MTFGKMVLGGITVVVGVAIWFSVMGDSTSSSPASGLTSSLTEHLTDNFERDINRKVVKDAADQYEIVKRNGSKMEACVHAGMVSAALVQAKDEEGLRKWKPIERADCRAAGMPSP